MDELKSILSSAKSTIERKIFFLGWLNRQLIERGVNFLPILVGGTAVAFYTSGNYATQDIDLVYSVPRLDEVLLSIGFFKEGRYWVNEELDLLLECSGSEFLGRVTEVKLENGDCVFVSSIEDMIIDRLNAHVLCKSAKDAQWARLMLESENEEILLDWNYLRERAEAEEVVSALDTILKEIENGRNECDPDIGL